MKPNHEHHQAQVHKADPRLMPVRFEFTHPTAATVCIAGTFNDWHPEAKAMHALGNGHWVKETVLLPGSYEYCLVVDGQYPARPPGEEFSAQPFWREKLDFEG